MNEFKSYNGKKETLDNCIQNVALNILRNRLREVPGSESQTLGQVGFDLTALPEQDRREKKLVGDLTHFALNNVEELIKFCDDTLGNKLDRDDFSDDFLLSLRKLYLLSGSTSFTNTLLSFYMENYKTFKSIKESSEKSSNFNCSTDLYSIRQSKRNQVVKGIIQGEVKRGYLIFSINLEKDINFVLDKMFNEGVENNPFKVHMSNLDYFRDLDNNFFAFDNFYIRIRTQFIENILNQTKAMLVGTGGDKAYFIIKANGVNPLEFSIYGIDFKHEFKIEIAGGHL